MFRAHAKINLCLEVVGKRTDGLHEIATVLQTISLADRLRFAPADEVTLRCRGMETTADDLILRAASLLRERTGATAGCAILCEKRIPVAAGLGGGSADAAATLHALNRLWDTRLAIEELLDLGAELGADVPFALLGGTALATGTGRTLERLPDVPSHWVVLVQSSAADAGKTAEMYGRLSSADYSGGARAREQAVAIRAGQIDGKHVLSAFTRPATERWPHVRAARRQLAATDAIAVSVSGAGPSLFGLYPSRGSAVRGLHAVRAAGFLAYLQRFVGQHEVSSTR